MAAFEEAAANKSKKKKLQKPFESHKSTKNSHKPTKNSLAPNKQINKKKKPKVKQQKSTNLKIQKPPKIEHFVSPDEHRMFFLDQFEFANGIKLSSLELDSIQDTYFLKLSEGVSQDPNNLGIHIKEAFKSTWKEVLCGTELVEGKVDAGNPAVLVISASAIKSLEMLRGLRILTKECQAVKLFSKHIKVDEQVAMLKKRVNIASGTPNRVKKLAEMEALGLSRLSVIVLDMHTDVKGYSLFTLPQIRDEFWDLYKTYFHQRLLEGSLRICLYGPVSSTTGRSMKKAEDQ